MGAQGSRDDYCASGNDGELQLHDVSSDGGVLIYKQQVIIGATVSYLLLVAVQ